MKIDLKKSMGGVVTFIAALTLFTGITAGVLRERLVSLWQLSGMKDDIEKTDFSVHQQEHNDEMFFHFARNMTDNDNTIRYHIELDGGQIIHEVDIRNTNEGYEMAFVYGLWRIYPVHYDAADSTRLTIKLHDYTVGEEKATLLIETR